MQDVLLLAVSKTAQGLSKKKERKLFHSLDDMTVRAKTSSEAGHWWLMPVILTT
jgi:hypothetical protein